MPAHEAAPDYGKYGRWLTVKSQWADEDRQVGHIRLPNGEIACGLAVEMYQDGAGGVKTPGFLLDGDCKRCARKVALPETATEGE